MGEAARRKAAEATWLRTLDEQEHSVVRTAKALAMVLPLDGACYRATAFLKLYLEEDHGISGEAVVGFVNDGTDDLYASHAWYMYRGQTTDLALCRPLSPEVQRGGPLLIQGRVFADGWSRYTYHLRRPPEGVAIIQQLMADPSARQVVAAQESLHTQMVATMKCAALMRAYLDGAPDGLDYVTIAARVRHAG